MEKFKNLIEDTINKVQSNPTLNNLYNNAKNQDIDKIVSYYLLIYSFLIILSSSILDDKTLLCNSKLFKNCLMLVQYIGLSIFITSLLNIFNFININLIKDNLIFYVYLFLTIGIILFILGIIIHIESQKLNCENDRAFIIWFQALIIIFFNIFYIYFFNKNNYKIII